MERREFMKAAIGAGALAAIPGLGSGCAHAPVRPDGSPETLPVEALMGQGARTMWVAAHPDDECFSGTLLARSHFHYRNPLFMFVMNHGDGGECCIEGGCHPDVATVRGGEMRQVAERYEAELHHLKLFNAPLPVESFPKRHEIYQRWTAVCDPVRLVATDMRRFKPDLVLTFEPTRGGTGHPEHQLASRIATAAIRMCADPAADLGPEAAGLAPHRVTRTYYLLNRYWPFVLAGRADPEPVTERWDALLPCPGAPGPGRCLDFMLHATKLHRTQANDMGAVRRFWGAFATMTMRQTDPFTEIVPPDEPAARGGMG
ncbi:MAG: PIG-L family deacetylase [Deltaproteobacteria bacterium]|nr:PIG-L family deacetylase [Deltaproteobacteria bacterium]